MWRASLSPPSGGPPSSREARSSPSALSVVPTCPVRPATVDGTPLIGVEPPASATASDTFSTALPGVTSSPPPVDVAPSVTRSTVPVDATTVPPPEPPPDPPPPVPPDPPEPDPPEPEPPPGTPGPPMPQLYPSDPQAAVARNSASIELLASPLKF